ncbi:hypothetical protein FPRO06_08887 [Fusarium proliferatum]|uniref:Peptidase metallopeptidase domain-containing protein n=1 Tax=Gibberella intermedia TaxID=948311 RepID=A0A365N3Y0_GIBIN|nr:hypothetical protein FPRO03_02838 [Fusarium proliferatum]KAI1049780.1 hypothetical protein LB506_002073 [Fusarium annulatum]KAG4284508.1 hypothetical protein FPRO06_08887 [Fusarium proliferatum]RBA15523.1 hypothetical protein FPRO05_12597 [Fusarium proliferatum]RKL44976.1 hypothetical protein BFJ72_g3626 [Fusarium proliferatum]
MAAVAEITKYPCNTQEETDPSFGPAPISNLAGTTGDNAPDEPDSLVVGFGTIVPRWDVKPNGGRKLEYFVQTQSFPSPDTARTAATAFQEAADAWNELNIGISITETTEQASANFYLVYRVNPSFGNGRNTLARAFFPHEIDQDVIVFTRAFDRNNLPILKNIFQHEIGHILGLRHEFAIEGDAAKDLLPEGQGAVLLGEKNYFSIMSYNFPPKFQDSDGNQTIGFYNLANGHMISGSPVTDFQPQIRRPNR